MKHFVATEVPEGIVVPQKDNVDPKTIEQAKVLAKSDEGRKSVDNLLDLFPFVDVRNAKDAYTEEAPSAIPLSYIMDAVDKASANSLTTPFRTPVPVDKEAPQTLNKDIFSKTANLPIWGFPFQEIFKEPEVEKKYIAAEPPEGIFIPNDRTFRDASQDAFSQATPKEKIGMIASAREGLAKFFRGENYQKNEDDLIRWTMATTGMPYEMVKDNYKDMLRNPKWTGYNQFPDTYNREEQLESLGTLKNSFIEGLTLGIYRKDKELQAEYPISANLGLATGGLLSFLGTAQVMGAMGLGTLAARAGGASIFMGRMAPRFISGAIRTSPVFATQRGVREAADQVYAKDINPLKVGWEASKGMIEGGLLGAAGQTIGWGSRVALGSGVGYVGGMMDGDSQKEKLLRAAIYGGFEAFGGGNSRNFRIKADVYKNIEKNYTEWFMKKYEISAIKAKMLVQREMQMMAGNIEGGMQAAVGGTPIKFLERANKMIVDQIKAGKWSKKIPFMRDSISGARTTPKSTFEYQVGEVKLKASVTNEFSTNKSNDVYIGNDEAVATTSGGKLAVKEAEKWAVAEGAKNVYIDVASKDIEFWEGEGYTVELKGDADTPTTMVKTLAEPAPVVLEDLPVEGVKQEITNTTYSRESKDFEINGEINGDVANLGNIEVGNSSQGKGLATQELIAFEKWAVENGATMVEADARRTALGFYEKMGYSVDAGKPSESFWKVYKDLPKVKALATPKLPKRNTQPSEKSLAPLEIKPQGKLAEDIESVKRIAKKTGVVLKSVKVYNYNMDIDADSALGKKYLKAAGKTKKELADAIKNGDVFIIAGQHIIPHPSQKQTGSKIRLYNGHDADTLWHEFVHAARRQGKLTEATGTEEEIAKELERTFNEANEQDIVDLLSEGNDVGLIKKLNGDGSTSIGKIDDNLGIVENSIKILSGGKVLVLHKGTELISKDANFDVMHNKAIAPTSKAAPPPTEQFQFHLPIKSIAEGEVHGFEMRAEKTKVTKANPEGIKYVVVMEGHKFPTIPDKMKEYSTVKVTTSKGSFEGQITGQTDKMLMLTLGGGEKVQKNAISKDLITKIVGRENSTGRWRNIKKSEWKPKAGRYDGKSVSWAEADMLARKMRGTNDVEVFHAKDEELYFKEKRVGTYVEATRDYPEYFHKEALPAYKFTGVMNEGNVKVKAYILDMPAIYTCANCSGCATTCYAVGSQVQYPASMLGRFANLYMFQHHRSHLRSMIDQQMSEDIFDMVRLHSSGEIFSQTYVNWLEEMVKAHPAKKFYTYTKVEEFKYDDIMSLPNFNLVSSLLPDGGRNYGDKAYVNEMARKHGISKCPAAGQLAALQAKKVAVAANKSLSPAQKREAMAEITAIFKDPKRSVHCATDKYKGVGHKCEKCLHEPYMLFDQHGGAEHRSGAEMVEIVEQEHFLDKLTAEDEGLVDNSLKKREYQLPSKPNRKTPLRMIGKKLGGKVETNLKWDPFDSSKTKIAMHTGYNPDSITIDGKTLYLGMSLEKETVYISGIVSSDAGSGVGSKFMNELKNYSDDTGHNINVYKITNPKFFEKFDWLTVDRESQQASYIPPQPEGEVYPIEGLSNDIRDTEYSEGIENSIRKKPKDEPEDVPSHAKLPRKQDIWQDKEFDDTSAHDVIKKLKEEGVTYTMKGEVTDKDLDFYNKAADFFLRHRGLDDVTREEFIKYEETIAWEQKKAAEGAMKMLGGYSKEQRLAIQMFMDNPKKYSEPTFKGAKTAIKNIEKVQDLVKKTIVEAGYPEPNYHEGTIKILTEKIARSKDKTYETKGAKTRARNDIKRWEAQIEHLTGLTYLHRVTKSNLVQYISTGGGSKKLSGKTKFAGRKYATIDDALADGKVVGDLIESVAESLNEVVRLKRTNNLINAINDNPDFSLPEKDAPADWVQVRTEQMPKAKGRKYHPAIGSAIDELTYYGGTKKSLMLEGYDNLNFVLKMINFYNPLFMINYDLHQGWRAAGIKFVVNIPKAWKIWHEQGDEFEKILEGGLFSRNIDYKKGAAAMAEDMIGLAEDNYGKKFSEKVKNAIFHPIEGLQYMNNITTWKADEILRIATYLGLQNTHATKGMNQFQIIDLASDFMAAYNKLPKGSKQDLNRWFFTPTYKVSMLRILGKMYANPNQFREQIFRHQMFKLFLKFVLPTMVTSILVAMYDEEVQVFSEKGYRIVVKIGDKAERVFAISTPLLEETKILNRGIMQTVEVNLAALPNMVLTALNQAHGYIPPDDLRRIGDYFKIGVPVVKEFQLWHDKDQTLFGKVLGQFGFAFAYTRLPSLREADKRFIAIKILNAMDLWFGKSDQETKKYEELQRKYRFFSDKMYRAKTRGDEEDFKKWSDKSEKYFGYPIPAKTIVNKMKADKRRDPNRTRTEQQFDAMSLFLRRKVLQDKGELK